ncbi:MAG: serine--tRNA ligase, partial [Patescibacteria group bacterium]
MLDIKFIRDNLDLCKQAAVNKNRVVDWDALLSLDEKRRELIGKAEVLRAERNEVSRTRTDEGIARGKAIKDELKGIDEVLRTTEEQFNLAMLTVPNVPDASVPVGKDESGNVEIKKWGTPTKFDFTPKDHIDLAKSLDLIDFERGAKVGGSRAYFLKNEAAAMEFAVLFYTFQKLIAKGY